MTNRLRRVQRLVELGERALTAARVALAAATGAVVQARHDAERDERAWSDAANGFGVGVVQMSDLDQQAAHLRTLRLRANETARRLQQAIGAERNCTAAVVKAAMDHRKLELWRDRIIQGEREEENRQERRGSDELAARAARMRQ